jgi:hypothetical protein
MKFDHPAAVYRRWQRRTVAHNSVVGIQININSELSICKPRVLKNSWILMGETRTGRHGKK